MTDLEKKMAVMASPKMQNTLIISGFLQKHYYARGKKNRRDY